jgi:dUTPase
MSLDLPFKRLSGTAIGPTKAYESDAAFDLYADHDGSVGSISTVFDTNVALAIPSGYGGLLMGRSSLAKESIHPLGFVIETEGPPGSWRLGGCIDQYRGGIKVMLASVAPGGPWRAIKRGEAIAQIWILPIPEIETYDVGDGELPPSSRGEKWAGSSNGKERAARPMIRGISAVKYFDLSRKADLYYHPDSGKWYTLDEYPYGGVGSAPDPGPGAIAPKRSSPGIMSPFVPPYKPPKKEHGPGTLAREKFQAEQRAKAEARYGRPCTLNEGTGVWEPVFPPIDADPFAGMIGGFELRAEWERKGRPPLPRYGSPHSEIEAAVRSAPEPAAILTPFVSVNPDIRPVLAPERPAQAPAGPDPADPPSRDDEAPTGLLDALAKGYSKSRWIDADERQRIEQWRTFSAYGDVPDPGPRGVGPAVARIEIGTRGLDSALGKLVETFDAAIKGAAREVAEAIPFIPRPVAPGSPDDDYKGAVAALVEDRFRNNFRLAGLMLRGAHDANHR